MRTKKERIEAGEQILKMLAELTAAREEIATLEPTDLGLVSRFALLDVHNKILVALLEDMARRL